LEIRRFIKKYRQEAVLQGILARQLLFVNTQKNIVIFRILGYNKVTNQHPQKKKNMKKKVGLWRRKQ
jgi:hypothetical protein